jgi:hypothetical protein
MTTTTSIPTPADAIGTALSAHPGATAAELAKVAGIGRSTANKALAALEQAVGCPTAGSSPRPTPRTSRPPAAALSLRPPMTAPSSARRLPAGWGRASCGTWSWRTS